MFLSDRFLVFIVVLFLLRPEAKAERNYGQMEPPRFKIGRLALKIEMDRFQSESNFNEEGKRDADLTGDFEAYNSYVGLENDLSPLWAASFGVLVGRAKSVVAGEKRTNLDVKGLQFGAYHLLSPLNSGLSLIADAKFFLKLHSNYYGSDEVSIGDGETWLQGGVWLGTDSLRFLRLWLYGGLKWPMGELSKNLIFSVRPEIKIFGGRLGAGIEGQIPVFEDKDTENPTDRLRVIDEYNGGSFYYHSINKHSLSSMLWFGFEPFPLTELKLGVAEVLGGKSAAQGARVFVNLEVSFSVTHTGYRFPFIKIRKDKGKIKKKSGLKRLKNYAEPKKP